MTDNMDNPGSETNTLTRAIKFREALRTVDEIYNESCNQAPESNPESNPESCPQTKPVNMDNSLNEGNPLYGGNTYDENVPIQETPKSPYDQMEYTRRWDDRPVSHKTFSEHFNRLEEKVYGLEQLILQLVGRR